jgi:hypothetical protein
MTEIESSFLSVVMVMARRLLPNGDKANAYSYFRATVRGRRTMKYRQFPKRARGCFEKNAPVKPFFHGYPDYELSQNTSSLYDSYQYHDNRNDKKYVDKSPHGVRSHQSQNPEDQQYDNDGFQHFTPSLVLMDK